MSANDTNINKQKEQKKDASFSKKAFDASKILLGAVAVKTADELTKIIIQKPQRPKEEGRVNFTAKTRPTRTFAQAARSVHYWQKNIKSGSSNQNTPVTPKKGFWSRIAENLEQVKNEPENSYWQTGKNARQPLPVVPGMDGIASFTILLVPFALFLGLLKILIPTLPGLLLIWILIFYSLLIALPGSYLGIDAMLEGSKELLAAGGETIKFGAKGVLLMIKIFIQGLIELVLLLIKYIMDNIWDYWILVGSYIFSLVTLWYIFNSISLLSSISTMILLVIIPALLPSALLHRQWLIYRFNKQLNS
jgi:hypothetical protein